MTSKLEVKVRCFECKQELLGAGTGQQHSQSTGHTWQPGYYCPRCLLTFESHKACLQHINEGVHPRKPAPAKGSYSAGTTPSAPQSSAAGNAPAAASTTAAGQLRASGSSTQPQAQKGVAIKVPSNNGTASATTTTSSGFISNTVSCFLCREEFKDHSALVLHYKSIHSVTSSTMPPSEVEPSSVDVLCMICRIPFSSQRLLDEHLAGLYSCQRCQMHAPTLEKLQEHYYVSRQHQKCQICKTGFANLGEWAEHRKRCPPAKDLPASKAEAKIPGPPTSNPESATAHDRLASRTERRRKREELMSFSLSDSSSDTSTGPTAAVQPKTSGVDIDNPSNWANNWSSRSKSSTAPSDLSTTTDRVVRALQGEVSSSVSTLQPVEDEDTENQYTRKVPPSQNQLRIPTLANGNANEARPNDRSDGQSNHRPHPSSQPASPFRTNAPQPWAPRWVYPQPMQPPPRARHPEIPRNAHASTAARGEKPGKLSFHCRLCGSDPCVDTVTTVCGHVFCHSCIVQELATKLCCPICQKMFLVRLHVESNS